MTDGKRLIFFFLFMAVAFGLLYLPYGMESHEQCYLADDLKPRLANNYYDPIFCFCLFAPALLVLESIFIKLPLRVGSKIFLIAQLIGVVWTWPIMMIMPLHIQLFVGTDFAPYWTTWLIYLWATYSLVWSILILSRSNNRRWIGWPFEDERKKNKIVK